MRRRRRRPCLLTLVALISEQSAEQAVVWGCYGWMFGGGYSLKSGAPISQNMRTGSGHKGGWQAPVAEPRWPLKANGSKIEKWWQPNTFTRLNFEPIRGGTTNGGTQINHPKSNRHLICHKASPQQYLDTRAATTHSCLALLSLFKQWLNMVD